MPKYCKAYYLKDIRRFAGWNEKQVVDEVLTDESIVYILDNFTVVKDPVQQSQIVFDNVTSVWQNFCTQVLGFEVPKDLQPAER